MVSDTTTRVPRHTPEHLNQRIREQTRRHVARCAAQPEAIPGRLQELDREWDIERVLEANASSLVVVGVLLGTFVSRWFYWIPFLVGAFLLQHAIQGWCPPVRLFRRLGLRTHPEIAAERYALLLLRGDLGEAALVGEGDASSRAEEALRLTRW
jgi:hypothetical protein